MKYYHSFVTKFLAITLLILISLIFWGNNKGFDLTDESLGVLLVQTNQSTGLLVSNTHFHLLVRKLLFFQPTITNLRMAFFVCGLVNSFFLSYFLHSWLKQKKTNYLLFKHSIYVYAFVLLGSFFAYQYPRTISYDIINTTISIIGLCFFLLAIIKTPRPQKILFFFLAGFFLSFLFFIKITTASVQLGIYIIVISIYSYKIPKFINKIYHLLGFFSGIGMGFILYDNFVQPIAIFIDETRIISQVFSDASYEWIFKQTFFYFPLATIAIISSAMILLVFFNFIRTNNYDFLLPIKQKKTQVLFAAILFAGFLYTARFFQHSSIYFILFIFLLLVLSSLLFYKFSKNFLKAISFNDTIIYILLLLQPLIIAFGTDNSLLGKASYGVSCWFVLIYAYLSENYIKLYASLRWQILALICIHCAVCLPYNLVFRLFRTKPLFEQIQLLANLPNAEGLYFDIKTTQNIHQIHQILLSYDFKKGDYILTDKYLGFTYLFEGRTPQGIMWSESFIKTYLYSLQNSPKLDNAKFFIIVQEKFITKIQPIFDELAKQNINIDEYDKIKINLVDSSAKSQVIFWIYAPKKAKRIKTKE